MGKSKYFSRGKLLLSGEYAVLQGAKALAIPTKQGQHMTVSTGRGSDIVWRSLDQEGEEWFRAKISLFDLQAVKTTDTATAERLCHILQEAVRLNSDFLSTWKGIRVETKLDFPREWGLGSSSTLVHNIAQWAEVNPFELYERTFGGSGYDIACAGMGHPILFQRLSDVEAQITKVELLPKLAEHLYFTYSGKKQATADALRYISDHPMDARVINRISDISDSLVKRQSMEAWSSLVQEHNQIVSDYLQQPLSSLPSFPKEGVAKPLGAWGGDFYLRIASSPPSNSFPLSYFLEGEIENVDG